MLLEWTGSRVRCGGWHGAGRRRGGETSRVVCANGGPWEGQGVERHVIDESAKRGGRSCAASEPQWCLRVRDASSGRLGRFESPVEEQAQERAIVRDCD